MIGENGVLVDVGEVRRVVDHADVFAVGFNTFARRLFVDTRSNEQERPLVAVVEPVAGPQERFFWLGQKRPSLGLPGAFGFFSWPHSPNFLAECGIWERVRQRVGADEDQYVDRMCEEAFDELRALEKDATLAAIKGENHVTLWPHS